jgi:hypothetical protein
MAANDSYAKPAGADEFIVAKFKPGYKAFVDPDKGWQWTSNPNYSHDAWYSSVDSAFEKRVADSGPLDSFSGMDHDKLANKPGEFYSPDTVPVVDVEFNEAEYWKTATKAKSAEQLAEELDAPRQALEEKWASYCEKAVDDSRAPLVPMWTPAMQMMVSELPKARKLNFELAPFFQLNSKGYRKNWANTAIAEYKPFSRWNKNNMRFFEDYMLRFQLQRVRMTGRPRFAVFKAYMFVGLLTGFADMMWCHEYRITRKWH